MQVTTIAEARALVGRTFARDGRWVKFVGIKENNWCVYRNEGDYEFVMPFERWMDWLSGATDVTEGSVSE